VATLIEELERDIPRAEEELGSDARIVREMRRQLIGLRAEQTLRVRLVFPNPTEKEADLPTRYRQRSNPKQSHHKTRPPL